MFDEVGVGYWVFVVDVDVFDCDRVCEFRVDG